MLVKHVDQTCWSNMLVKHVGQTCWSNIVGRNMFDPFEHHNQTCWTMLDEVWLFSNFSSNIVQHFRLRDQKYAIISCLVLKSNMVGWFWIRLNTPSSNTIQHWSNIVQHHLQCWIMFDQHVWSVWTGLKTFKETKHTDAFCFNCHDLLWHKYFVLFSWWGQL